jgi:hypothetical protein
MDDALAVRTLFMNMIAPSIQYQGTAFFLEVSGAVWLITAAHNLEERAHSFVGMPDRRAVNAIFLNEGGMASGLSLWLNEDRTVRYADLAGTRLDFAAVKVAREDLPQGIRILQAHKAIPLPTLDARPPTGYPAVVPGFGAANIEGEGRAIVLGFPLDSGFTQPASILPTVLHSALPKLHSNAIVFAPGGASGYSGGPVFRRVGANLGELIGFYTHSGDITGTMLTGPLHGKTGVIAAGHGTDITVALLACADPQPPGVTTVAIDTGEWFVPPTLSSA